MNDDKYWPVYSDKFDIDSLTNAFHNGSDLFAIAVWGGHGAYFRCIHRDLDKALRETKILEQEIPRGWRVVRISMTPVESE